jgi:uncharacterized protein
MASETILWRRLDTPGHDACRLEEQRDGWRIEGVTVFRYEAGVAALVYQLECDGEWRTRNGFVSGWVASDPVSVQIARSSNSTWELNGVVVPDLQECADLDFGFTPAANLPQLRRIALEIGQSADVPVARLDVPFGSLELLRQRYNRRTAETYWYEAPRFHYAALLQVNDAGFVERYPGLWEAELDAQIIQGLETLH